MKSFEYKITDETGLHARPAGQLVKAASAYSSEINLFSGEKSASAKKLFALMALGIKCGDTVRITVSGDDEDSACCGLEKFFKENL